MQEVNRQSNDVHTRFQLLRRGRRLEALTIAWMLTMAVITTACGIGARSALLLTVGAGSAVDMLSACALFWHLGRELNGADVPSSLAMERIVSRLVGVLLGLTAFYAVGIAVYKLWLRVGADNSIGGIAVALIAAVWLPYLAREKIRIAKKLSIASLHADGVGTLVCGLMSAVILIGLGAQSAFGWWWLDAAGALLVVPMLIKESFDAFRAASTVSVD